MYIYTYMYIHILVTSSDNSFKKTLYLMNNCPQDLLLSFFLSSLTNQVFGLGCGLLTEPSRNGFRPQSDWKVPFDLEPRGCI